MLVTLALDAATSVGSVAVFRDAEPLAERDVPMRGERGETLLPAVVEALADARVSLGDLERLCCGAGPGSFTSLRIAASIAKGIACSRRIPLFARSSLLLLLEGRERPLPAGSYLATLDALRGELFCVLVTLSERGVASAWGDVRRVAATDVDAAAREANARVVGDAGQSREHPRARGFARAAAAGALGDPVDLATWEPEYGRAAEAQARWESTHGRALGGR